MRKSLNVIFVYCTENYPHSFSANNTKISLLAGELVATGNTVTILNNPKFAIQDSEELVNGVKIINRGKDINNVAKLHKFLNELYCKDKKNIVVLSCGTFPYLYRAYKAAYWSNYKVGYIYQEDHMHLEKTFKGKLNAYLCDQWLIKRYDFVLPISEYLIDKTKKLGCKYHKLPITACFPENASKNGIVETNIVYCASVDYSDPLNLLLMSYGLLDEKCRMNLVLSGSTEKINAIRENMGNDHNMEKVKVLTKLPFDSLINLFQNASVLMIPLRPNYIPDIARFSQKIAEYLSTGRPILTTNVGEIPYYFKDDENAFICDYSAESVSQKLNEILNDAEKLTRVGMNGYRLGKEKFDVKVVTRELCEFLLNI